MKLILASSSPRRIQMCKDFGLSFHAMSPNVDERQLPGEKAVAHVCRLADEKAAAVFQKAAHAEDVAVLSADTIVVFQKQILGKPKNPKDALHMLSQLSGKKHDVVTAFCWKIRSNGCVKTTVQHIHTKVQFAKHPKAFWNWYVSTKEPMDKAGAYGAQGRGHLFIKDIQGSYANVVGLPMVEVQAAFFKLTGQALDVACR